MHKASRHAFAHRKTLICIAVGALAAAASSPALALSPSRPGSGEPKAVSSGGKKERNLRATVEQMNKQLRRHGQRARAVMHAIDSGARLELVGMDLDGATPEDLTTAADTFKADIQAAADAAKAAIDAAAAKLASTLADRGASQKLLDRLAQVVGQSKSVCDKFAAKSCDRVNETLDDLLAPEDEDDDEGDDVSSSGSSSGSDCPGSPPPAPPPAPPADPA